MIHSRTAVSSFEKDLGLCIPCFGLNSGTSGNGRYTLCLVAVEWEANDSERRKICLSLVTRKPQPASWRIRVRWFYLFCPRTPFCTNSKAIALPIVAPI
mmetsp:Transcript_9839/g.23762  ORF Transcript_9839/g.23762 Transcript_9839/m.23762 type:complete len:99 (+) Transcript_9839:508-804(+)